MTCVITEFGAASPSQGTPFVASIELYDRSQIREMLKEHLEACCRFLQEDNEGLDEEEQRERECEAQTAFDSFRAMFASKSQFETEDNALKYLRTVTMANITTSLDFFSTWIQEFLQLYHPQENMVTLRAATAEDLSTELEPWVTTNEDNGCRRISSWWPIVRIIRVNMESRFLEQGIVVADLPGKLAQQRNAVGLG